MPIMESVAVAKCGKVSSWVKFVLDSIANCISFLTTFLFILHRLGILMCLLEEPVSHNKCYIDHICVSSEFRGKGVGKVLMERADYEARKNGCKVREQF